MWELINDYKAYVGFRIIFTSISFIEVLINSDDAINYTFFIVRKLAIEIIIGLNVEVKKYEV